MPATLEMVAAQVCFTMTQYKAFTEKLKGGFEQTAQLYDFGPGTVQENNLKSPLSMGLAWP